MALLMHSQKRQVSGMIQIQMVTATIWSILMVRLGAHRSVEIVAKQLSVTLHSTDGVVPIQTEMGGQILPQIGSLVRAEPVMLGRLTQPSGPTVMAMDAATIRKGLPQMSVQTVLVPQSVPPRVETDGVVSIPMVMDGQT